jgi:hypothetical protein
MLPFEEANWSMNLGQEKELTTMKHTIKNTLVAAVVLCSFGAAYTPASAYVRSNFVVQELSTTPQNGSEDLLLRSAGDGNTYLYVEQQQGALLAVFDVTDPRHMKLATSIATEAHKTYDFVTPIGSGAELVAFRDGSGTAVLDFRDPKAPRLAVIGGPSNPVTLLGGSGYLAASLAAGPAVPSQPRDLQLVEIENSPRLLNTFPGVTKQVGRAETGTIFLLGQGKVTVIRRLDTERQYEVEQASKRNLN